MYAGADPRRHLSIQVFLGSITANMNEPTGPTPADGSAAHAKPRPRSWLRRALRLTLWLALGVTGLVALFHAEEYCRGRWAWHRYSKELLAQGVALHPAQLAPPPVPDEQNFAMTPCLAPLYDFLPGTQTYRDPATAKNCMRLPALPPRDREPAGDWTRGIMTDLPAWPGALQVAAEDALRPNRPSVGSTDGVPSLDDVAKALNERFSGLNKPKPPRIEDPRQAATAVLRALQPAEAILDELRTASLRPYCRFNIRYQTEPQFDLALPHLKYLQLCSRTLGLRAVSRLVIGEVEAADMDLRLALRLIHMIRDEPMLISQQTRQVVLRSCLQVLWEGLKGHLWSDAQLQGFGQQLGEIDLLTGWDLAMRGERAWGNANIVYIRQHLEILHELADHSSPPHVFHLCLSAAPRGWLYLEQVRYNRICDEALAPRVDLGRRVLDIKTTDMHEERLDSIIDKAIHEPFPAMLDHTLLAGTLTISPHRQLRHFAQAQALVDEAMLACALERHRLAAGEYPEALEKLVPRYIEKLPHDLITGEPLKYRRTADGGFILYSVGWNQQDDGGRPPSSEGQPFADGDWVFRVP